MRASMTLTFLRIAVVPFFIIFYYLPFSWAPMVAAFLFALTALTDWLDGHLARRLDQTSRFGEFLDPVADKFIIVIALVLLVGTYNTAFVTLPSVLIIFREVAVSAIREWMARIGKQTEVKVGKLGKIKTVFQFLAVFILILHRFNPVGYVLLFLALILTLKTMASYLAAAWPYVKKEL